MSITRAKISEVAIVLTWGQPRLCWGGGQRWKDPLRLIMGGAGDDPSAQGRPDERARRAREEDRKTPRPSVHDRVDPFPIDIFPAPIAGYGQAVAATMPCPLDFVGLSMMTIAGSLIGACREIAPKRTWHEIPMIYAALVGHPGDKKTPALDAVARPVHQEATSFVRDHEGRMEEYERAMLRYEAALSAWKKTRANPKTYADHPVPLPKKPEKPVCRRLEASDTTVEALALVLKENARGIVLLHDELSGWVRGLNQYKGGRGNDREFFLRAWSGTPITVDRKVLRDVLPQGHLRLPRPALSVLGGIPPTVLPVLSDERGFEDGFPHRILFTFPEDVPDAWTEAAVDPALEAGWAKVVRALLELDYTIVDGGDGWTKLEPVVRMLDEEAMAVWEAFQEAHHAEVAQDGFDAALRGPWRKLESYVLRVALILYELQVATGAQRSRQIAREDLEGGIRFVTWAKSHLRRVYRYLRSDPGDRRARQAVAWIEKRGGTVTLRDVLRSEVAGVKRKSDVEKLFKDLQDRGFGTATWGRPVTFTLNPKEGESDE